MNNLSAIGETFRPTSDIPGTSFTEKLSLPNAMLLPALVISGIALTILSIVANSMSLPISVVVTIGCTSAILLALSVLKLVKGKQESQVQENTSVVEGSTVINPKSTVLKKVVYDRLPNKNEFENISMIVKSLGSQSILTLPTSRSALKKAGSEIGNLHPLRFLACSLTDAKLKEEMIKLYARRLGFAQSFVWDEFYNDYSRKLTRQNAQDNLVCYLDQFALDLKLDGKVLHKIVDEKRWQDFFKVIFEAQ